LAAEKGNAAVGLKTRKNAENANNYLQKVRNERIL
jgi:hypothetical protein